MSRTQKYIAFGIVLISFFIRVIRLDIPHDWSFDEVYHALSAEAYALNDPRGYEWWNPSPKDLAWEWLHPPLGKLFMAASIRVFAKPYIPESKAAPVDGATTFAWRFPGTIFAALTVWLLIKFGKELFENASNLSEVPKVSKVDGFWVGAVAGLLYAFDGLVFVQSRTGMNDIFVTFFVVLVFYRLFRFIHEYPKRSLLNLLFLGLASGLAASTKWTGFYAVGIVFVWGTLFLLRKKDLGNFFLAPVYLLLIPTAVYILSYGQWWVQGHTWEQFAELHRQIWWYQTNLKATHDYQSQALTWPILYRPVWFYVKYQDMVKDGVKKLYIGNIYTMGNPLIWWVGIVAVVYGVIRVIKGIWERIEGIGVANMLLPLNIILVGYFGMFLPWALSPRIMFMYHYLPSVPFLCLALALGLNQVKKIRAYGMVLVTCYLSLVVLAFIFFYPHWTAVLLPQDWIKYFFWLPSWK